jgi:hypothetical protein
VISPDVLQLAASVGFLVIGSRLLIKASRPEPDSGEQESGEQDGANADGPEAP